MSDLFCMCISKSFPCSKKCHWSCKSGRQVVVVEKKETRSHTVLRGVAPKGVWDFPGSGRWVVFAAPGGSPCAGLNNIQLEELAQK